MILVELTRQEASALSLAALCCGTSEHRSPELESARKKLREALDGRQELDKDQRFVRLEC